MTAVFLIIFGLGLVVLPAGQAIAATGTTDAGQSSINCYDPAAPGGKKSDPQCGTTNKKGYCTDEKCIVANYVNPLINILSILVGVLVVVGVILGGIQYSTSAGDPQKAAAGRARIMKALIALLAFVFLRAFLTFIIPGGL